MRHNPPAHEQRPDTTPPVVAGSVMVVPLAGALDAGTVPAIRHMVRSLVRPGRKIVLDLASVPSISSAGMRLLVSLSREIVAAGGALALAAVADEITETFAVTGFRAFFAMHDTVG